MTTSGAANLADIMRIIKLITLELRPRLQTCNVFICVKESVNLEAVKIRLSEGNILLSVEGNDINFQLESVKLIPTSLSALSIKNDWISFHVQTRSEKSYGSFNAEIITTPRQRFAPPDDGYRINEPLKGSSCRILCKCCKNVLSKTVNIKRVLPFPDVDYIGEWFCHGHCGAGLPNLSPQETDLFYGSSYSIVHSDLFDKDLRVGSNVIICGRCLNRLGEPSTSGSYKLWNCCVNFVSLDGSTVRSASDPLDDFLLVIRTSLNGILGEELVLYSRAEREAHQLSVKPINQQLTLMTEAADVAKEGDSVQLERISVMKVLYRYETETSGKVASGQENTKRCDVALPVIEAGFKHLLASTRRFPQVHRVAAGYYIGHVRLEEPVDS